MDMHSGCYGGDISVSICNHCEHRDECDRRVDCGGCYFPACSVCEDADCANNVSSCSWGDGCGDCQFYDECNRAPSHDRCDECGKAIVDGDDESAYETSGMCVDCHSHSSAVDYLD